ncbi:testis-expressed protein 52 [Spea bombifrons]|uniref:testis-expressed protein 52 n=1 Tax=Spea bombifrons TaxID=233779 RepID=UPI00234999F3|nr:testis-expressed protein 52 [Spea bombifrons]
MLCSSTPEPLLPEPAVSSPGFTCRGIHNLLRKAPPYTEAKLELLRKLRSPREGDLPPSPTMGYMTWLEISNLPPLLPLRPDKPYDSAVWRTLTVASSRPTCVGPVPPPSRMEENTWGKFMRTKGVHKEGKETRSLLMRSLARVPQTDCQGNILPPQGFKRHPTRTSTSTAGSTFCYFAPPKQTGICSPQHPRSPRKATPGSNPPNYRDILQRYRELQGAARSLVPFNSRMPTPRTAAQETKGGTAPAHEGQKTLSNSVIIYTA